LRENSQSQDSSFRYDESFLNPEKNAIKLYLQQIGQIELLKPEEEIELASRIRKGDRAAAHKMVMANLRLVVKIAHDYAGFGLPLSDLVSEGNIGLMKAVERFDPGKGGKLSTYAAWWIKQSIKRALANQSKTIRLPVHMVDKIARMRRMSLALAEVLGREPTNAELAIELGMTPGKVAHIRSVAIRPASLDAPVGDEESTSLGEIVGDPNESSPCEILHDKAIKRELSAMLSQLEAREADIIRLRFGLDGDKTRTLEEVGAEFGITRERVRQLQNLALGKMRKIFKDKERQRSREQIVVERTERGRTEVLQEYIRKLGKSA